MQNKRLWVKKSSGNILINADIVVGGSAMYNFGLTLTLKAWIDRISVAVGIVDNNLADLQEDFLKTIFNFTG